ncbi:MAG: hypothetical protein AAGF11_37280 [Myxococcota bacterium]
MIGQAPPSSAPSDDGSPPERDEPPPDRYADAPARTNDDDHASEQEHSDDDDDDALLNEVVGAAAIYPQEQAEIQATLVIDYLHRRPAHEGTFSYVAEIGATDWWQFELGLTAPAIEGGPGMETEVEVDEAELGTQLTWMHMKGSPFSGALAFEVGLPLSGDDDETVEYEPFVTIAVDPPSGRAQVFANLGAELSGQAQSPFVRAGVIGSVSLTRPYLVVSYSPEQSYVVPGVSLILPHSWEIVLGIPVGLTRASATIGGGLQLIYEWNPLERRRRRARNSG